jgi:hypothetical protein
MLLVLIPLLPIIITLGVIRAKLKRGQRTAEGRAMCDQVEGFRSYLATAEADQLKFEEGEDIFSKYLPWAILFGMAKRWAKICSDLVTMGRLPNETPYWYLGQLPDDSLQHRIPDQQPHLGGDAGRIILRREWYRVRRWQLLRRRRLRRRRWWRGRQRRLVS